MRKQLAKPATRQELDCLLFDASTPGGGGGTVEDLRHRGTDAAVLGEGGTDSTPPQLSGPPTARGANGSGEPRGGRQEGAFRQLLRSSGAVDRDRMMRSARRGGAPQQGLQTVAARPSPDAGNPHRDRTPLRAKQHVVSPSDPDVQHKMSHVFLNRRLTGRTPQRCNVWNYETGTDLISSCV